MNYCSLPWWFFCFSDWYGFRVRSVKLSQRVLRRPPYNGTVLLLCYCCSDHCRTSVPRALTSFLSALQLSFIHDSLMCSIALSVCLVLLPCTLLQSPSAGAIAMCAAAVSIPCFCTYLHSSKRSKHHAVDCTYSVV